MAKIEIKTERLQLKPLGMKYLKTMNEYALDFENSKYMTYYPYDNEEETINFLKTVDNEWSKEKPSFFEFAIIYGDKHVGSISVWMSDGKGELGWIINKKYWRQHFALEAASALIDYFSTNMGVYSFIAHCDYRNIASYKLMEKLGMIKKVGSYRRTNRSSDEESLEFIYELEL